MRRWVLALAVVVAVATGGLLRAQGQTTGGTNRTLSPAVVASWQAHENGDGTGTVDLLVLWRGSPGWFTRGKDASGGGGSRGGFATWSATQTMTYGDITLTVDLRSDSKEFDRERTTATILGQEIPLRDVNVVMVDGVDTSAPTVVAMRRVDATYSGPDPLQPIIQRTPELFEFLRCDTTVPDPQMQAMFTMLCDRLRP